MTSHTEIFEKEVGVNDVIFFLWKRKKIIILIVFFFAVVGVVYALLQKNQYQSEAIITISDDKKAAASGFGLGGAFASQLGMGSSGLSNIQTIVEGREIAKRVIVKADLLPFLYPAKWDSKKAVWNEDWDPNKMCETEVTVCAADLLRKRWLNISLDTRRDQLRIRIASQSRDLSRQVLHLYLNELNLMLREAAIKASQENQKYLQEQLTITNDPALRQGILDFVTREIARSTLLKSQAFEVLQEPSFPIKRYKPNRRQIVMIFGVLGLAVSVGAIFLFEYVSSLRRSWEQKVHA